MYGMIHNILANWKSRKYLGSILLTTIKLRKLECWGYQLVKEFWRLGALVTSILRWQWKHVTGASLKQVWKLHVLFIRVLVVRQLGRWTFDQSGLRFDSQPGRY